MKKIAKIVLGTILWGWTGKLEREALDLAAAADNRQELAKRVSSIARLFTGGMTPWSRADAEADDDDADAPTSEH